MDRRQGERPFSDYKPGTNIDRIQPQGWTQIEAARRLGVSQPRIAALMRGKLSRFSLDGLAATAGLRIRLSVDDAA